MRSPGATGRRHGIAGVRATAVVVLGLAAACSGRGHSQTEPFRVVEVLPDASGAQATDLLLNQELTVRFSAPLDRSSVSLDTIRVLDAQGLRVAGDLRIQSQTVTFVPRSPVRPDLSDGSFVPGRSYTFEVVGFPRAMAVRAADGSVLPHSVVRRYRAVSADASPALLPDPVSPFGFALDGASLGMASGSPRLRLYFYDAPHPATVRPEAFRVIRARSGGGLEEMTPCSVELRALPQSYPQLPGWAVDLQFDEPPVRAPDYFAVELVGGEHMLRDLAGQPPKLVQTHDDGSIELSDVVDHPLLVRVYQGERVPLLEEDFGDTVAFQGLGPDWPTFEARDGHAVPLVRVEAGNGCLGRLLAHESTVLEPGRKFDRGDGTWVQSSGAEYDFTGIFVPHGSTLHIRPSADGEPVVLRSCANVRIEGDVVLEGTPPGPRPSNSNMWLPHLLNAAGVAIVAAGDVVVTGQIRWEPPADAGDEDGSPLSIVASGGVALFGRIPEDTVLATEPRASISGTAQAGTMQVILFDLTQGLPAGVELEARAATEWMPLPRSRLPRSRLADVEVELRNVSPELSVEMEVAPPDAVNGSRPDERPEAVQRIPVPSSLAVALPQDGFVRFVLRAPVRGGEPLPTLDGIVLRTAP